MGLISKTVNVKWHGKTRNYYESLGYVYTKNGDEFEAKVEDIPKGSHVKVNCKCDGCGKDLIWKYRDYYKCAKENGHTYCNSCSKKLSKGGRPFLKSFYDWCLESGREDVLMRWDYELNNCSPKEVGSSTDRKYYFKCNIHLEHISEQKRISDFTHGCEGSIACRQCNSIAQYILDNFPDKDLYEVWDKNKNGDVNPWKIDFGSDKKIWVKCQEKDYHDSYEISCFNFSKGVRCPYCVGKKIHPKDSLGQFIIDNYGEKFLWSVWSDKNKKSPFDIAPNSKEKIWWKCIKNKHDDYLRTCTNSFACEFRCPKCVKEMKESIIEEKTRVYLEKLGYSLLHEHECTLKPINPKTKHYMPYDNEIKDLKLIIEVHGAQHYSNEFYKTRLHITDEEAEKMLKQRRLYDRYKKAYAEHYNYNYLELPYTAFQGKNKELYKQMIDDKIEEILHNTKAS